MSFECMAWAIQKKTGSVSNKTVLMHLANCTNHQNGMCRPRIKLIAEECEVSEATVKRSLKELSELGLIKVIPRFQEGQQLSNDYQLLLDATGLPRTSDLRGVGSQGTQVGSQGTQGGFTVTPRETGSETGNKPDHLSPASPTTQPGVSEQRIIDTWNAIAETSGLAKVAEWTPTRRKMVKARLKEFGTSFYENFAAAAKECGENKWAKENRQGIEHILRPENFQRYLDSSRTPKAPPAEAGAKPARVLPDFVIRKIAAKNSEIEVAKKQLRRDEIDKGKDSESAKGTRRLIARLEAEIAELEK